MGAERLLQPLSRETEADRPQNATTAFLIVLSRLLSLSVLRAKVFRSLIVCKTFYHLDLAQTSPTLLFLPRRVTAAHSKKQFLRWTTYEIDAYHVQLFLNLSVSEAAKTLGKSQ